MGAREYEAHSISGEKQFLADGVVELSQELMQICNTQLVALRGDRNILALSSDDTLHNSYRTRVRIQQLSMRRYNQQKMTKKERVRDLTSLTWIRGS